MKRTLLLAVVFVALASLGCGTNQKTNVLELETLGGRSEVDPMAPGRPVIRVDLSHTQITDEELKCLNGLTQLKELKLTRTQVTGEGLEHVRGMVRLQRSDVRGTKVTDAGLEHLTDLKGLQRVDLRHTYVTADGAESLHKALPSLIVNPS